MLSNETSHIELSKIYNILTKDVKGEDLKKNLQIYKAFILSVNLSLSNVPEQIQSDYTEIDIENKGFIKNKPFSVLLEIETNISTAANITPVNLIGMSFSYQANSIYVFDLYMFVSSVAATTGIGLQLDVSSIVTKIGMNFFHQLAATGTITGGSSVTDDSSLGVSSGVLGTGINFVNGKGILITGDNSGTAQFRFRSEVAAITTCNKDSKIIVTKIK